MQISNKRSRVGFEGVAERLTEAYLKWGGVWTYTIRSAVSGTGRATLHVVLERRRVDDDDHTRGATRSWCSYPDSSYGSFASRLYQLCEQVDAKLNRQLEEAESQTAF